MSESLTITEIKKPQKTLNVCHIPDGTIIQFKNGCLGLVAFGGLVQLTNPAGEYKFEVLNKSLVAPCTKRLGKLIGITVQKE